MQKLLGHCLLMSLFLLIPTVKSFSEVALPDVDSPKWTKKYDAYFRKYTKRYFGVWFDYRWFKAQAIAESALNKDAKSWVGAKGLMQIMPKTFEEIRKKNPDFKHVLRPRWNIAAGIFYDRKMFKFWKSDRSFIDKISFAFASYNAGVGNILKGQKRCQKLKGGNCNLWKNIEPHGVNVKTWRHKETIHYIKKIFKLMEKRI